MADPIYESFQYLTRTEFDTYAGDLLKKQRDKTCDHKIENYVKSLTKKHGDIVTGDTVTGYMVTR